MSLNPLYHWVGNNNPSNELSYSKGWWDFIEFNYKLIEDFDVLKASVKDTFILNTPPPCEKLEMPIVELTIGTCNIQIKNDFSNFFGPQWFLLIQRNEAGQIPGMDAFMKRDEDHVSFYSQDKFLIYPDYADKLKKFSMQLSNEYEVYGVLRLIANSLK